MDVTSNHSIRQSVAEHICLTQAYVPVTTEGLRLNLRNGAFSPADTSHLVASNASMTNWFSRWFIQCYDRSKASSKASSPHSAIQSFLLQMRVSSPILKVFLRLLPCLPVTSIPPFIFPSVTRCRRQFRRKM